MKILIFMEGFFPGKKYGGPPVSVNNFCSLMKDVTCKIVTKNHDYGDCIKYGSILDGWNNRENCEVLYLPDNQFNMLTFKKIILEEKPDILYLQGLFQPCVFPCLIIAKKNKIDVLLAPRGELCKGAFAIRKLKKIIYINIIKFLGLINKVHFQSTSSEESVAIHEILNVENKRIHKLNNIPSIPKSEYIHIPKKTGEARFVFLARIHPKKNLLAAISFLHDVTGNISFDIYGPIEDDEYWKQCNEEINSLPSNVKVTYRGLVNHEQVHEVLSKYDALIFPTFSENYGHVIAESLIVGTPVITSDQTPWSDMNKYGAGAAISLNSREKFVDTIKHFVSIDDELYRKYSDSAIEYVAKKTRIELLRKQYNDVLHRVCC